MQGLESQTAYRFLHTFHHALYSQKRYYPSHECRKIDTKTPDYFAHTRERLLEKMFTDPAPTNIENGFAFFSEYCTYLLMRDTLAEAGIIIDLAPQELEEGSVGRKGVDIILSTHHKLPKERVVLMGINVKLRKMRTNQITESHIYDPRLKSPYVVLALGNWKIKTNEQQTVYIREWIQHLAIPAVISSGKMPYFSNLKRHVFRNLENTLHAYLYKTHGYLTGSFKPNEFQHNLFPSNDKELHLLHEKLLFAHSVFAEIATTI